MLMMQWEAAVPLEAFVRLLPDMATLLGNDYFSPVDPKTRQAKGFVKRVTVVLTATGRQRIGDVTDKVGPHLYGADGGGWGWQAGEWERVTVSFFLGGSISDSSRVLVWRRWPGLRGGAWGTEASGVW
jgi:hypothetical protein